MFSSRSYMCVHTVNMHRLLTQPLYLRDEAPDPGGSVDPDPDQMKGKAVFLHELPEKS